MASYIEVVQQIFTKVYQCGGPWVRVGKRGEEKAIVTTVGRESRKVVDQFCEPHDGFQRCNHTRVQGTCLAREVGDSE